MPAKHLLTGFLLALSLFGCSPKATISPANLALSQTANQFILPWHQQFVSSTTTLSDSLERFCQNPSNQGEFEAARKAWIAAMMSWENLRVINFGPVVQDNQGWRIQFWPDSHNRVGRKVDELLLEDKPISAESLAEGVVLVQGLSAIEYMLFDPEKGQLSSFTNPKACEFVLAASQNTQNVAQFLSNQWQPLKGNFLSTFLSPGPTNLNFPTEGDAIGAVLSALVSTLEVTKGKKIAESFGGPPSKGKINPYKLELWRSQTSLQAIQTEVRAVHQLYGVAIKPLLIDKNQGPLANNIEDRLARIQNLTEGQPGPLFVTLRDPKNHAGWQTIWDELGAVLNLLKRDVPTQLSLKLGFNSNDGD